MQLSPARGRLLSPAGGVGVLCRMQLSPARGRLRYFDFCRIRTEKMQLSPARGRLLRRLVRPLVASDAA